MSTPVLISIGSNVERETNLHSSILALRSEYGEVECSPVYESKAVGFDGDDFYNLVARVYTDLSVETVDATLTRIEDEHGRDRRGPRFSPRTLDLDLLLFGNEVRQDHGLEVPRDEITRYAFVLKPLMDIAGDTQHPTLNVSINDLWHAFDQPSQPLHMIDFNW
ncbi:MAG TPA: 2-amino-4-hydroxy-6-hydroxymethyldihydropteridine diphosphokinase [Chromatiaceae bacterium]|jgi:2-amino-4-hydroxy-6-hydroxymethyldihydropteridine diphosphokinase|nr:2-amino-4-hydroxy-6-hydroxymethyldihydropteridine diphosphokinase [Chromatiaceae bacterium]HIB84560.1 2-amino-4-hydroxy-6-hydroxymethyldihydropteridine diphosphokinase [Chromatiaceae bacterium]HIO14374.1 2-amino-4-hydroxy-6-hydroxymethyldihydropteridine diphosphokinase [Chromatiales bacterium]HIO53864.1 2-amino-4-hydroxy-6-hydroxymethyldihydropteridine diphosphokinase [Chromatiales bacterium]